MSARTPDRCEPTAHFACLEREQIKMHVTSGGGVMDDAYERQSAATADEMPKTGASAVTVWFTQHTVGRICGPVRSAGARARVAPRDVEALLMAASEIVTNAIRYGGGGGRLTARCLPDGILVEICDEGPGLPDDVPVGGAGEGGLHLARMLCSDLVIDSSPSGVKVRMFMRSRSASEPRSTDRSVSTARPARAVAGAAHQRAPRSTIITVLTTQRIPTCVRHRIRARRGLRFPEPDASPPASSSP